MTEVGDLHTVDLAEETYDEWVKLRLVPDSEGMPLIDFKLSHEDVFYFVMYFGNPVASQRQSKTFSYLHLDVGKDHGLQREVSRHFLNFRS